jgi:hypothetical protein
LLRKSPKTKFITPTQGLETEFNRYLIFDKEKADETFYLQDNLFDKLKKSEIEVDEKIIGKPIESTQYVKVDTDYEIVYNYTPLKQRISGEKIERKPFEKHKGNINDPDMPLISSFEDKFKIKKKEVILNHIITKTYILHHLERDHFDDVRSLAKELAMEDSLLKILAFKKEGKKLKRTPIFLRTGSRPYLNAFLEGRVKKNAYLLLLHLSDRDFTLPSKFKEVSNE